MHFLKVIPEYQRAVIFRLGRVEEGDAKGPGNHLTTQRMRILFQFFFNSGIFFIIPCTDSLRAIDLRTVSFDVPPQEVSSIENG